MVDVPMYGDSEVKMALVGVGLQIKENRLEVCRMVCV